MIKSNFHKAILFLMALFISVTLTAQTEGLGTWNLINLRKNLSRHWSIFGEAQIRSQQFYNHFHYHEYKGGFGYQVAPQFNVVLAAGQYVTYTPHGNLDTVLTSEFRLWQQFTLSNTLNRVKIEHRYRAEQRWVASEFRNRFRYRINVLVPLNKRKMETSAIYATAWDEIFLTNLKPYFERNRLFGGLGYVFSDAFTLQAGMLRQYDFRRNGSGIRKDYLQMSLLFSLIEEKTKRERHPGTTD